jgi:hypothetical protein
MRERRGFHAANLMKKFLLSTLLLLAGCRSIQTPVGPTAIVNQYPTLLPTPTLAVVTKSIEGDEKEKALNFFYELKIRMASGDFDHFVETIRYPITVNVDGQPKTFVFAAELEANFEKIFSKEQITKFISTDESELTFTPNGIKVADGIVWINLICINPDCSESEFLITEINN